MTPDAINFAALPRTTRAQVAAMRVVSPAVYVRRKGNGWLLRTTDAPGWALVVGK
jgi:hypothetical protein